MAPATQKVLGILELHAEWKILTAYPVPTPGPNEVLVKVVAAGINWTDALAQKNGSPAMTSFPWIGGFEGSGVIEELGPGVTTFAKGEKMWHILGFRDNRKASFQEYAIVALEDAARFPDNISLEEAASIPLTFATAVNGLWARHPDAQSLNHHAPWEDGGMTKFVGQPAFIIAGPSSVGQHIIQMARIQGYSPIITTASLQHEAFLKSTGATHVLDRFLSHAQLLEQLPKLTGEKPILYAYDASRDGPTQHVAYDALAPGGGLVVVSPPSGELLAEREKRDNGSVKVVRPFGSFTPPCNRGLGKAVYARLPEWLKTRALVPNRVKVIPGGLEGVAEACKRHLAGDVSGVKLVVRIAETA